MAENQQTKSKRDMLNERMRKRYPEKNFDNEEDFYGQISDDFDNFDNELAGYKEREQKIADMFAADPRSAVFMSKWMNGEDPQIELVRQFGIDVKDAADDPQKMEAIAEANKEFVERVAEEDRLEKEYKENLAASLTELDRLQQEMGVDDETINNAVQLLADISSSFIVGKITPEAIQMAMKAISHDADVAQAAMEGEVKGRNSKVEEKLRKPKGDGMPSSMPGSRSTGMPKDKPNLGALDRFDEGATTIWGRGNEKRIVRR